MAIDLKNIGSRTHLTGTNSPSPTGETAKRGATTIKKAIGGALTGLAAMTPEGAAGEVVAEAASRFAGKFKAASSTINSAEGNATTQNTDSQQMANQQSASITNNANLSMQLAMAQSNAQLITTIGDVMKSNAANLNHAAQKAQ
jgi:hypothetical protein